MTGVVVVYHSGYGHTAAVARSVLEGARGVAGVEASIVRVEDLNAEPDVLAGPWAALHGADAIVLGTPTYMGTVSGPFKQFMDRTGAVWGEQRWAGKLGAGFTNSGSPSGDKVNTLVTLAIFAAQHSMVWVPAGVPADPETGVNRLGGVPGADDPVGRRAGGRDAAGGGPRDGAAVRRARRPRRGPVGRRTMKGALP